MKKIIFLGALFWFLKLRVIIFVKGEELSNKCWITCVHEATNMVCRLNSLDYPNVTLPREVQNLDLSNNEMRALNNLSFPDTFATLRTLNLSNNYIETIDEGAFAILFSVQVIDLSHNRIQQINESLIEGNTNLSTLILDDNCLIINQEKPLLRSESLKELNMRRVGIVAIAVEYFSALPLLEQLDLSLNRLSSIDSNAFSSLLQLQWLDLSENEWSCEASLSQMVAKLTKRGVDVRLHACGINDSAEKRKIKLISTDAEDGLGISESQSEMCQQESKIFTLAKCIAFASGMAFAIFGSWFVMATRRFIRDQIAKRRNGYKGTYKVRKVLFTLNDGQDGAHQAEAMQE